MARKRRTPHRWVKWVTLLLWLAGLGLIIYLAYRYKGSFTWTTWVPTKKTSEPRAVLNVRELLYFAAPLFTILFTLLAHLFDALLAGGGIAQRGQEIERLHDLRTDVITGTMTKQSVLVALASIFIVFVQQEKTTGETDYFVVVRWVASAGFLTSIFLMLISVKTYDYANRFNWQEHPDHIEDTRPDPRYRLQLVRKAFRLDVIAFYFLLYTAIIATGLIERWFPIAASLVCGLLLWTTYFFSRGKEGAEGATATLRPHSVTLSVHDADAAAQWYRTKLKFSDGGRAGLLEKNGFGVELVKVEAPAPEVIARLSFRVDDVDALANELKAAGVEEVEAEQPPPFKQFTVRDVGGVLVSFVQRVKKASD